MVLYRISGGWKNSNNVITHYAFHNVEGKSATRAIKMAKDDAVKLLETRGNAATTWVWDYVQAIWEIGEEVTVVNGISGKYLRSNPDDKRTDNLEHLIDFDWIAP